MDKITSTPNIKPRFRRGYKFQPEIYLKAREQGLTKVKAGRKAGLEAREDKNIIKAVDFQLRNNSGLKNAELEAWANLEKKTMEELNKRPVEKFSIKELVISAGTSRDKIELMQRNPALVANNLPRLVIDKVIIKTDENRLARLTEEDNHMGENG